MTGTQSLADSISEHQAFIRARQDANSPNCLGWLYFKNPALIELQLGI
jgi:hypothetical protein